MIEDNVTTLETNAKKKKQLIYRLNTVYDRINMKTGLILTGFQTVMASLAPFLTGLATKNKGK